MRAIFTPINLSLFLFSFFSFSFLQAQTITYGQSLMASLDVEGEEDLFTFDATQGDRIMIRMRDADSGVDACLKLYSPSMELLGEHCGYGGDVEIFNYTITSNGTYNIMVSDRNDNDTGLYGLTLELLNPDPSTVQSLVCGETVVSSFEQVVDCDAYSFNASAGDYVYFQIRSEGGSVESEMMLFDGQGELLETKIALTNSSASIPGFEITETGFYTLFCLDKNGNDTGDYELSFAKTGDESCIQFIGCDDDIMIGELDHKTSINVYALKMDENQEVNIRMVDKGVHMEPMLDLYSPSGVLVDSDFGYTYAEVSSTSSEAGFYQIVAMDDNANNLGTYAMRISGGIYDVETQAVCNELTLALEEGGTVSLSVEAFSSSIAGACGIMSMNLSQSEFDCDDLGTHLVTLTISDESGSLYTCESSVTIEDPNGHCNPSLCPIQGENTSYEWIERVVSYEVDNTSGDNGGYADYTNMVSEVSPGTTLKLLLEPGYNNSTYKEYWSIWVDLNENGNFEEDEWLYSKRAKNSFYAWVPIPVSTEPGLKTMRIIMSFQDYENPCGNFDYGEAEDYTINVIDGGPNAIIQENPKAMVDVLESEEESEIQLFDNLIAEEAPLSLKLYPNPNAGVFKVDLANTSGAAYKISVLDGLGQMVFQSGNFIDNDQSIELDLIGNGIQSGTYFLKIEFENGEVEVQPFVVKR